MKQWSWGGWGWHWLSVMVVVWCVGIIEPTPTNKHLTTTIIPHELPLTTPNPREVCLFLTNVPGVTIPPGDIILEEGQDLEIFCRLTNKSFNSSSLSFRTSPTVKMDSKYITVVNETTIRMLIPNMKFGRTVYHCMLDTIENPLKVRAVCLNTVIVATKPKPVANFKCFLFDWARIYCNWTSTVNTLRTNHCLAFSFDNKTYEPCVNSKSDSSFLETSGFPVSQKMLYFKMNIENNLGTIVQFFSTELYKAVLPKERPIINLQLNSSGPYGITLSWEWPEWSLDFPPGLVTKIHYKTQRDAENYWHVREGASSVGQSRNERKGLVKTELDNLAFANTLYDIRVYVKSAVADDTMWSQPVVGTIRTLPTIPDEAPIVDIGSFKTDIETLDKRRILVYWKQVPEHTENGDNFRYTVQIYQNYTLINKKPDNLTKTMAKFTKLNTLDFYTFRIYATNDVGNSLNYAELTVPPSYLLPAEPEQESFVKVADDDGITYELHWTPPYNSDHVTSYTIFWCRHKKHECTGFLNWTRVDGSEKSLLIKLPNNKDFQFLISANTHNWSSGMVWASCAVLKGRVPDVNSVSDITFNRLGSDFIEVSWILDCSSRVRGITQYIIFYCPIAKARSDTCIENEKTVRVSEPKDSHKENRMAFNVTSLKPYTTYKLSIALITGTIRSGRSTPQLRTTLEAAPSPPNDVKATKISNTTATIVWSVPTFPNGMIREYRVTVDGRAPIIYDKDTYQATITDLKSSTSYNISVSACTVAWSPPSVIEITTKIGNPDQVEGLKVAWAEGEKMRVEWSEAGNVAGHDGVGSHFYQVSVHQHPESSSPVLEWPLQDINVTYWVFATTDCKTVYNMSVRAVNVYNNHTYPGPWSQSASHLCTRPGVTWVIVLLIFLALLLFLPLVFRWSYIFLQSMICIEIKMPAPLVVRNMAKDKEKDTPLEAHIHQPRPHLFVHNNTLYPSDFPATDQLIHLMMDTRDKSGGMEPHKLSDITGGGFNNNNHTAGSGNPTSQQKRKKRASSEQLLKMSPATSSSSPQDDSRSLQDFDFGFPVKQHSTDDSDSEDDDDDEEMTQELELKSTGTSSERPTRDAAEAGHYSMMVAPPPLSPTVILLPSQGSISDIQHHPSFSNLSGMSSVESGLSDGGSDACLLRQRNVGGATNQGGYCQMATMDVVPAVAAAGAAAVAGTAAESGGGGGGGRGYVMQAPAWSTKPLSPPLSSVSSAAPPPAAAYCVIGIKHPPQPPH